MSRESQTGRRSACSGFSAGAQYTFQGRRGKLSGGPSDAVVVQFGVDGNGLSVVGAQFKMAA